MPSANKTRRLWFRLSVSAPKGVSRAEVKGKLLDSIRNGSYELPRGYQVTLHWGNKGSADRSDEWGNALAHSASSSPGFDRALESWIRTNFKGRAG